MLVTVSGVRSFPTIPRISYSLKICGLIEDVMIVVDEKIKFKTKEDKKNLQQLITLKRVSG